MVAISSTERKPSSLSHAGYLSVNFKCQ